MSEVIVYLASDLHPSEHVVLQPDFDSCEFDLRHAQSELAALREELATAKRANYNAEVALKAAYETQELWKGRTTNLTHTNAGLQQRLTAAEQRNADDLRDAERYRSLRTVTPYRFKKMQDSSVTDGGDVLYFHSDRFDALMDIEMAKPTESGASE